MAYGGVSFLGRFTNFRHVGVFPEQVSHWQWVEAAQVGAGRPLRILNLFAYTGTATVCSVRRIRTSVPVRDRAVTVMSHGVMMPRNPWYGPAAIVEPFSSAGAGFPSAPGMNEIS